MSDTLLAKEDTSPLADASFPVADGPARDAAPAGSDGDGAGGSQAGGPCVASLCEDFETGVLDTTLWATMTSGGKNSVTIQSDMAAHGKWALKAHAEGSSAHAFIYSKKVPSSLRTHQFGRAYMYITPSPPVGHTMLVWAGNSTLLPFGDKLLEIQSVNGSWASLVYFDRGFTQGSRTPLDRWMCLEWEFNDLPDTITLWVDGKQALLMKDVGSNILGGFASVGFGHRSIASRPAPIDIYVDDIAVGTRRIGCLQ